MVDFAQIALRAELWTKRKVGQGIQIFGGLVIIWGAMGAVYVFGSQIIGWLKEGEWTPQPVFLYAPPEFVAWLDNFVGDWQGIAKIIVWFLSINAGFWSIGLFALGFYIYGLGLGVEKRAEPAK
jgi:hypothetical protein